MAKKRPGQIINPLVGFGQRAIGPYANRIGQSTHAKTFALGKCFFIQSVVIGDPNPEEVIVTFNEDQVNCTSINPAADGFRFYSNAVLLTDTSFLDHPTSKSSRFRATGLVGGDGPSNTDRITMDYIQGTCGKSGDAECVLDNISNAPVNNRILGVQSAIVGNVANDVIEITLTADAATIGSQFSVEVNNVARGISGSAIVSGKIQLTLSSAVTDNDTVTLSHNDVTGGATSTDGRALYQFLDDSVNNQVDTVAPTVPQNLVATTTGSDSINLVWDASTDAKSGVKEYVIYRASVEIDRVAHPTTTYDDTGLSPATSYSYTVSAVDNANNESAQSLSDSATTWQSTPVVVSAEVGNVSPDIIVVNFNVEVVAADYAAGWTFTEEGSPAAVQSAAKTAATQVQFTLVGDISIGTTVAYNYNAAAGNYENTDGIDMESESGSVTNNVAELPDFIAFSEDSNGVIKSAITSVGTASFIRATEEPVTDHESLTRVALPNEIRFENARRVENLFARGVTAYDTEDLTVGAWSEESSAVILDANTVELPANNSSGIFARVIPEGGISNKSFRFRLNVSGPAGEAIRLELQGAGPSFSTVGGTDITLSGSAEDVTSIVGTFGAVSDTQIRVRIRSRSSNTGTIQVDLTQFHVEDVTGQANQNPGEYVSEGVLTNGQYHGAFADGVRYYAKTNPVEVDGSNRLTETASTTPITDYVALLETADSDGPTYDFANFSQTEGTWYIDFFLSTVTGQQNLFNVVNADAGVLYVDGAALKSTDGTGTSESPATLTINNRWRGVVDFATSSTLEVGARDIDGMGSWQWDASPANYDGSFTTDNVLRTAVSVSATIRVVNMVGYQERKGKTWVENNI